MNQTRQQIIALLLAIVMVAGAGCAGLGPGWGEDGPADSTENDEDADGTPLVCGYATDVAHSEQPANTTDCPTDGDSDSDSDTSDGDGAESDTDSDTADGDDDADADAPETHSATVTLRTPGPDSEPLADVGVTVVKHDDGERVASGTTDENGEVTFDLPRGGYELLVDHETTDHVAIGTFLFAVDGDDDDVQFVLSPPIEGDGDGEDAPDSDSERENETETDSESGSDAPAEPPAGDTDESESESDGDGDGDGDGDSDDESEPAPDEPAEEPEQDPEQDPEEPESPTDNESPSPEQPTEPEQPGGGEDDPETHTVTVYAGEAVPVDGVEVTIAGTGENSQIERTLTTDESGRVTFGVPDGEYTVTGVDPRGDEQTTTVTVAGEDTSVLLDQMAGPEPPIRSVTFEVVDAETGEPVDGAIVSGVGGRLPGSGEALLYAETDAAGTATVEAFESSYDLDVRADGYETRYQTITVDEEMTVTIELTPEEPEPEPEPEQPAEPSVNETSNQTTAAVAV